MIYTVGITKNYDKYLEENPNLEKEIGGSVWQYPEQADKYLQDHNIINEYSVYGVDADWQSDTRLTFGEFRALTVRAKITKL